MLILLPLNHSSFYFSWVASRASHEVLLLPIFVEEHDGMVTIQNFRHQLCPLLTYNVIDLQINRAFELDTELSQ